MNLSSSLYLIPLGGCGEIGMNMTVLCIGNKYFFIDAGAMFPDSSMIGVDLVLPNTNFIDENYITPEAWLITHGHEDHIGALTYLFKKYPAPIYGTEFTIELIKSKFEEAQIYDAIFNIWDFFNTYYFRNIKVTIFPVNHSIAHASGFFIETKLGNILHMGDFRIDMNPPEGSSTHENIKKVLQDKTVSLMMSDSTNSFQEGTDFSEADVNPSLIDYMEKEKGVLVIATFASNIWRLKSILEAAYLANRKIVLFGRSLLKNIHIASKLNLIDIFNNIIINIEDIKHYPRNEICIICTGSQGEIFSGLHRLTWNNVTEFNLTKNDTVIFSSRIIPGNEKQIESLITQLTRMDCKVITAKDDKKIHVSGHGYQQDLKTCIEIAKPLSFLPVHGTYRHLRKHRELAIESGVPSDKCFLAENGDVVMVGPEQIGVVDQVYSARDYVCPGGIFSQYSNIYKERVLLSQTGIAVVSYCLNDFGYELISFPSVSLKGIQFDTNELSKKSVLIFNNTIEMLTKRKSFNDELLQEELRIAIRRFIEKRLNFKTTVIILLNRADNG